MPQQAVLEVLRLELLGQEGILPQIDHPHRQMVGSAPSGIEELELLLVVQCHG